MVDPQQYRVLKAFRSLFENTEYRHRASNQGDLVASYLVDDLYELAQSTKLVHRVDQQTHVGNLANTTVGKKHRRGDGTFGQVVPLEAPQTLLGHSVAFAAVANVEIGTETKILAKSMIKQLDRVGTDMINQAKQFRLHGNNPICVAIVGINRAPSYRSLEGDREWLTGVPGHKHPVQEAQSAETRLVERVTRDFDEVIVLRYVATNISPFKFSWVDEKQTIREYGASLVRLSSLYEHRF